MQNTKSNMTFFLLPFLMGINIDLYVPSLPAIAHYFKAINLLVQLTISAYMLSYCVSQIALGLLSDIIGRRKILLICSQLYIASCVLAIFATNIYVLIIARLLQGFFIGGLAVAMRAAAADSYSGVSLTRVMSNIAIGWSLGPIIAPLVGGYLQYYFSWQADFVFLFAYGIVSLVIIYFNLPETKSPCNIIKKNELFTHFKNILFDRLFFFYSVIGALIYSILVIFNVIGPFLMQNILKVSVVSYGHMALILGMAYCLGNLLNRYAISHFKPLHVIRISLYLALLLTCIALLVALRGQLSVLAIMLPLVILFILCGFIMPNVMGKFSSMFKHAAGTASAIAGFLGIAGVFVMSLIATLLKSDSQLPMLILYAIMLFCCLMMLSVCLKKESIAIKS